MSSSPVEFSIAPRSASADPFRDRRPPWSEDAERAVLAAMLLSVEAIITAGELVAEDMFYRESHRRLFRAIDPLEHQTQIDYGGIEALSAKQREKIEAQWDRAAREVLAPERLALYMATKDPLYKQAQLMAMQYGLNGKAVQALHAALRRAAAA